MHDFEEKSALGIVEKRPWRALTSIAHDYTQDLSIWTLRDHTKCNCVNGVSILSGSCYLSKKITFHWNKMLNK